MAKTMKSYRFEDFTLKRLSWLANHYDLSDTSTIELLITETYLREKEEEKKHNK
ncbi:MAG: hypothetical protein K2K53_12005 [Oscillospiraceae bacterium]|nr:hypothetical protein [Oscillospiraceae bacterium]